ncbi:MAG TPA: hypothetical protein VJ577_22095 [Burkholderiaceae bacterium]|nr:hypothetical protein [Burkholderiaceae bacterium]
MDGKHAVRVTFVYRAWQLLSGLLSLFFVTSFYSAEVQGYYFTFVSLLTIQTVFELGITYVITTVTAHEMVGTSWKPFDAAPPPRDVASRLSALFHVIWRRALKLVIGFILVVTVLGFMVMRTEKASAHHEWVTPWVLVVAFYGLKICITLFEGFLEGMSQVKLVARTRLFSSLATSVTLWAGISAGAGLYAVAISAAISVAVSLMIYRCKFLPLALRLYRHEERPPAAKIWDSKTQSFQTRMAISWICGYVVFQTLVPIAFYFLGAVEAGRIGLSLSLCSAVTAIGSAWIGPKVPELSRLAKELNLDALKECLRRMLKEVGSVNLLLVVLIAVGNEVVPLFSTKLADRLPNGSTLLILLIATVANQYITVIATFSRSFKIDPFAWPTAFSACVSILLGIYLTRTMGATGAAAAYGLSMLVGLFPFSVYRHILLESGSSKFYGAKGQ